LREREKRSRCPKTRSPNVKGGQKSAEKKTKSSKEGAEAEKEVNGSKKVRPTVSRRKRHLQRDPKKDQGLNQEK